MVVKPYAFRVSHSYPCHEVLVNLQLKHDERNCFSKRPINMSTNETALPRPAKRSREELEVADQPAVTDKNGNGEAGTTKHIGMHS